MDYIAEIIDRYWNLDRIIERTMILKVLIEALTPVGVIGLTSGLIDYIPMVKVWDDGAFVAVGCLVIAVAGLPMFLRRLWDWWLKATGQLDTRYVSITDVKGDSVNVGTYELQEYILDMDRMGYVAVAIVLVLLRQANDPVVADIGDTLVVLLHMAIAATVGYMILVSVMLKFTDWMWEKLHGNDYDEEDSEQKR